jgi:hypothetical protein
MTKVELELRVRELTEALATFEKNSGTVQSELDESIRRLQNINKPVLSSETQEKIRNAIDNVISKYDFGDTGAYEVDFEINYNNEVCLSNIDFDQEDDLAETLTAYIEDIFNIEDCGCEDSNE